MANKRISDLTATQALTDTDEFAVDDASSTTRKIAFQDLGTQLLETTAMLNAFGNKQDTLTFDNAPTDLSTNPVYSGGVYTALTNKKDKQTAVADPTASGNTLAFIDTISQDAQGVISVTKKNVTTDSTPTENSTNPVQSGGVKSALDEKKDLQDPVSSPSASGNTLAFIDTITQDEQGVLTATKKTVTTDSAPVVDSTNPIQSGGVANVVSTLNADLANKQDASTAVRSVNSITPTNGDVAINAEDIPADGIGDKSVSGNPIIIEDGMASVAKELSVTLEPIQDLHGYESPWIGTDTDKQPYLFRAVADSSVQDKGTHELDKLIGGTVAFNQLVSLKTNTVDGISASIDNDGIITISGTSERTYSAVTRNITIAENHKYYVSQKQIANPNNIAFRWTTFNSNPSTSIPNGDSEKIVFFTGISGANTGILGFDANTDFTGVKVRIQFFDLTAMFGSTIADYIYSLEQATAGAGVAWFRKLFPAPYYAYDSGTLMSVKTSAHVMRGFNQWDEEWEVGRYNPTGTKGNFAYGIRSKNPIRVIPSTDYFINCKISDYTTAGISNIRVCEYDANNGFIRTAVNLSGYRGSGFATFTTSDNAKYIAFSVGDYSDQKPGAYYSGIIIGIGSTEHPYEPYTEHSYPLDPDLELRGIPKLDSNNKLYYDGDIYESSGNVQRRYGVVDLGTIDWSKSGSNMLSSNGLANAPAKAINTSVVPNARCSKYEPEKWTLVDTGNDKKFCCIGNQILIQDSAYTDAATFKTAMSGVMLVYELATPTTETADPYTSAQVIDVNGTEEYVDSRTVPIPVGHESNYANICPIEGRTETAVTRSDGAETDPDTDTASVTFGQTVYGGQVDFVSGKCRLTHGISTLTGAEGISWSVYRTSLLADNVLPNSSNKSSYLIGFCSHVETTDEGFINASYIQKTSAGSSRLQVNDVLGYWGLTEQTSEAMNSKLAEWNAVGTPLQIVYELETPIELTLTPAQLSLLQGTNILTADGTIILTYLGSMASNVQNEIDEFENGLNNVIGSIAFIENSTAKTSHVVGEYVILNGIFCKVISAISSGETLSFGTNIQATTIGAELRAIWAQISA